MAQDADRIVSPAAGREEEAAERAIRPRRLAEYVGQPKVKQQLGIFVDAARIFALASGVRAVNTNARLADSARAAGLAAHELAAVDAAFAHILRLRLSHQLAVGGAAVAAGQGIVLDSLHEMDRAILKESLRQARRLKQRLKLNYGL